MAGGSGRDLVDVLLVEDDPADVVMVREAFNEGGTPVRLHAIGEGEQAMRFPGRAPGFEDAPRPGLILLDLGLPLRGGLEVLADLKSDAGLRTIPVVVLSVSQAVADIQGSYSRHADARVIKPPDFGGFTGVVRQIAGCFLDLVQLPAR